MSTRTHLPGDKVDQPLSDVAARQHGLVTAGQLVSLGLGRNGITQRVKRGALHRVYRGVYSVGHAVLSQHGKWLAPVLAGGDGAALGLFSSTELFELRRWKTGELHVVVPRRRTVPGVHVHRTTLHPLDVVVYKGIPVTNVARTLVDLTDLADEHEILAIISEAAWRKRLDLRAVEAAMARANGRHGLGALKRAVGRYRAGEKGPKSRAELAFLRLPHDTPPRSNGHVEGEEVDAHWPEKHLIVEVDGHGHARPAQRRDDVRRDAKLREAGWTVIRVAAKEVEHAPERVLSSLRSVGRGERTGL